MAGTGIHPYHQQWAPAAAAPPPPPPAAAGGPPPHPGEEVRTIFITGLPEDVKERELQNLLRWLPGFEASQLNFKAEKPMGFALFSAPHQALTAKDILQDMLFDPDTKSVLHTEMAKKNLFVKRGEVWNLFKLKLINAYCESVTETLACLVGIGADAGAFDQSKRLRTAGDYTHTGYTSPSPFHPPPPPVWGPHGYMAPPPPPPYDPYAGYPVAPVPMPTPAPIAAPSTYVPVQVILRLTVTLYTYCYNVSSHLMAIKNR